MALLDKNAPVIDNIQRASFLIDRAETTCEIGKQMFATLNNSFTVSSDDKIRAMQICRLVNKILYLEKLVSAFTKTISKITEIYDWLVEHIVYDACGYLIKKIEIVLLRIKCIILNIKIYISKATRDLLVNCISGKGAVITAVLFAPLQALMAAFQLVANVIGYALMGINFVLGLIPKLIRVSAEGMSFFMTPKSMKTTEMTVVNVNQSINDKLGPAVKTAVATTMQSVKRADVPIKIASIAAGAAAGVALAKSDKELEIPESCAAALSVLNSSDIATAINLLIAYIPVADPLPKYENLVIYNPGFMVWLLTGFLPAARMSFGIPGMP